MSQKTTKEKFQYRILKTSKGYFYIERRKNVWYRSLLNFDKVSYKNEKGKYIYDCYITLEDAEVAVLKQREKDKYPIVVKTL